MLTQDLHLQITRDGVLNRRSFLRNTAVGGVAALSWMDVVRLEAAQLRQRGKACILLFMQGGPSQFETFDPKPGVPTGGPTKAIKTAVPGIDIAQDWDQTAKAMKDIAIIRSMTAKEGNHQRAQYQLHTGYLPSGAIKYPSLGAIVASEHEVSGRVMAGFDLPHFVSIGTGALNGSGFLGAKYAPYIVQDPNKMPANSELPDRVSSERLQRRLKLMDKLEVDFKETGNAQLLVKEHRELYATAERMVLSPRLKAFNLDEESKAHRDRFGRTPFGQGCLLARRLVQTGVTFVEVLCNNSGDPINWDTHKDNFSGHTKLAGLADPAFASLVEDLKTHGMLENTLVVCMGEFGRTPQINPRTGRDHYPNAFSIALAGGGIKGGQVIGDTGGTGVAVVQRPVTIPDLFSSFYKALGINPRKELMSSVGRPVKILEGGEVVKELFA